MLLSQLLAQRCTHDGSADAGRSTEVRLARLPPRGMEGWKFTHGQQVSPPERGGHW